MTTETSQKLEQSRIEVVAHAGKALDSAVAVACDLLTSERNWVVAKQVIDHCECLDAIRGMFNSYSFKPFKEVLADKQRGHTQHQSDT